MARTPSTMLALGTVAPDFSLPDTDGHYVALRDMDAPALLVMFICNHCPFVKHIRHELARLGRDYLGRGVGIIAISSNDALKYPDDSPASMTQEAQEAGYSFPYCFDETQEVAKAFRASCTPDFFVFDRDRRLVYRGQLDDSRPPGRGGAAALPVTGADLRAALDSVLSGQAVPRDQKPSIGCNIKWKPGNEPDDFAV
jgi:peroxiredoxin